MKKITQYILILFCFAAIPAVSLAYGTLSLSQTSVNLNAGQNQIITASTSSNQTINLTSLTNSYVAYANISGNQITVYGLAAGSTNMTFCTFDNTCGTLYVTVGGTNNNNGQIGFSQNYVTMTVGSNNNVTVANSTGQTLYLSNNSNPNVVSANFSGNLVSLNALNPGTSTITVAANGTYQTATLTVNVTGNGNNYGNLSFSQNNLTLSPNQNSTISIYPGSNYSATYYISGNSNSNVASASISGSSIYVYAVNSGNTTIAICGQNNQCGTLYVTVTGGYNQGNLYFTSTTLPQPVLNQYYSNQLAVAGGTAPYIFTLDSGTLPYGLVMNNSGLITGYATSSYNFSFIVRATDYYNHSVTSQTYNLTPTSTGNVLGAYTYANGTLVNDNGTIYLTYKNTKSPFANAAAFTGLGYSFANTISGSTTTLNFSGFTITNPYIAHPWGSWIKNGTTIYFVHDQGLIPVSSFDVFLGNGGSLSNVVNANTYDMNKPILPVMALVDPRLK